MPYMKNGHRDYETRVRPVSQQSETASQSFPENGAAETGK
jgi:hypothetical protein